MWAAFCTLLERWRLWRLKLRRGSPRAISAQAREIAHLADLAERAVLADQHRAPLRLLREEMEALALAAGQQDFIKLPLAQRYALAERLDRTRDFIITTLQEGTPPTQRRQ